MKLPKFKLHPIPDWIKNSVKYALKDKVFTIAAVLMLIAAVLDLFTQMNMTGGLGFFFLIFLVSLINGGYWKWRFENKEK